MSNTYCVYTVSRYSWLWTVDMSKTCRVLYQINMRNCPSHWLLLSEKSWKLCKCLSSVNDISFLHFIKYLSLCHCHYHCYSGCETSQDRQCKYKLNNETRSLERSCLTRARSITYFECACVSVALVIQHANCMRHVVICGLSDCTIFFHIIT